MDFGEVSVAWIAFIVLVGLMKPLQGLVINTVKVTMRVAIAGLSLQLTQLEFIDNWSETVVGWTHIAAIYVPVFALILIVALHVGNTPFISGTRLEEIARLLLYVIGGVFTVGNVVWTAWEASVSEAASGLFASFFYYLLIWAQVFGLDVPMPA